MKKQERNRRPAPAELPKGRPLPHEASPGGVEGADSASSGGASNVGAVVNPKPEADTTYSTRDMPDVARRESVRAFVCDKCGEAFDSEAYLNIHRRTSHRPRA